MQTHEEHDNSMMPGTIGPWLFAQLGMLKAAFTFSVVHGQGDHSKPGYTLAHAG